MRDQVDSFGEETREILWQGIGRAMTEFQKIEFSLKGLFLRLIDGNDNVSAEIFRTAPALTGRLDLIKNAAQGFASSRREEPRVDVNEIKNAMKLVRAAAENRNLLAHSAVAKVINSKVGDAGFWLQAKQSRRTVYLNSADIDELISTFEPAAEAIRHITARLMNSRRQS